MGVTCMCVIVVCVCEVRMVCECTRSWYAWCYVSWLHVGVEHVSVSSWYGVNV